MECNDIPERYSCDDITTVISHLSTVINNLIIAINYQRTENTRAFSQNLTELYEIIKFAHAWLHFIGVSYNIDLPVDSISHYRIIICQNKRNKSPNTHLSRLMQQTENDYSN